MQSHPCVLTSVICFATLIVFVNLYDHTPLFHFAKLMIFMHLCNHVPHVYFHFVTMYYIYDTDICIYVFYIIVLDHLNPYASH